MKIFKILFTTILLFVLGIIVFFFVFSDSYKLSVQARMKYAMGDYEEAKVLAKEAFELDPYNKMAFSILAQSKISVQLVDYIKDSNKYLRKIEELSLKGTYSGYEKTKIKMMCEVMIGRFNKLSPTVMTDKALYDTCVNNHNKFKKIYAELF